MSYAGCVSLFKTPQCHVVRFSFMPMVMKSRGLKPIEAQNARSSSCSRGASRHINGYVGHGPKSVGAVCDPSALESFILPTFGVAELLALFSQPASVMRVPTRRQCARLNPPCQTANVMHIAQGLNAQGIPTAIRLAARAEQRIIKVKASVGA
jgi:hypothetical protein